MQVPFSGGCPCGALRFTCAAEPVAMYNCHCGGCQKRYGAPYAPLLVLPAGSVQLSGESITPEPELPLDKHAQRTACARCGFPMLASCDSPAAVTLLNAMSLDDPSWFRPVADIWTAYAQPWVQLDSHIPKVYKSPPVLGGAVV